LTADASAVRADQVRVVDVGVVLQISVGLHLRLHRLHDLPAKHLRLTLMPVISSNASAVLDSYSCVVPDSTLISMPYAAWPLMVLHLELLLVVRVDWAPSRPSRLIHIGVGCRDDRQRHRACCEKC
jgi:hypothetical protein